MSGLRDFLTNYLGQGSADDAVTADPAPADAGGSGVTTIPEVTVVGDPNATGAADPPADPPVPVAAVAGVPFVGTGGTPGVPLDPSVVDATPWTPIPGGGGGAAAGADGAAVASGGAAAGTDGAVVAGGAAAAGTDGAVVAGGAAAVTDGAVVAGGITLGGVATAVAAVTVVGVVAAAAIVGTEKIIEWAAEPPDDPVGPETPGDPDNPNSGHGVAGAPEQTPSNPYALPTDGSVDGGSDDTQQAPSANIPAPSTDPSVPDPAQAPAQAPAVPAVDPSTPDPALAPGQSSDPAELAKKKVDNRPPPAADIHDDEGPDNGPSDQDGDFQRISDANKKELENSGWLKTQLPDPDDRRKFMQWLEDNHRMGGRHDHLRPGSPEANQALGEWRAENP